MQNIPPPLEKSIGMETYLSKSEGVGGRIKTIPEDFIVEEVTQEGEILEISPCEEKLEVSEGKRKEYVRFTLQKKNWDTMRAMNELSKRLRISRNRMGFAGTKDKRAITSQKVSVWNVSMEELAKVRVKDMWVRDLAYSDDEIKLGDLSGNRFTLTIRDVGEDKEGHIKDRINGTISELRGRIPAFFGVQRFGVQRPITHLVGKYIVKREFEEAAMTYLSRTFSAEGEEATDARGMLAETRDFKGALKTFPKHLGYEKAMLNHLVQHPSDFIGAFRELPKKLRWLFVHAYQSYIFNKSLSRHILEGRGVKALPLVGHRSRPDGITEELLMEEGISVKDFDILEMPEMSSAGEMRDAFTEFKEFEILSIADDDLSEKSGAKAARVRFSLPKGTYATVLLREITKNEYW